MKAKRIRETKEKQKENAACLAVFFNVDLLIQHLFPVLGLVDRGRFTQLTKRIYTHSTKRDPSLALMRFLFSSTFIFLTEAWSIVIKQANLECIQFMWDHYHNMSDPSILARYTSAASVGGKREALLFFVRRADRSVIRPMFKTIMELLCREGHESLALQVYNNENEEWFKRDVFSWDEDTVQELWVTSIRFAAFNLEDVLSQRTIPRGMSLTEAAMGRLMCCFSARDTKVFDFYWDRLPESVKRQITPAVMQFSNVAPDSVAVMKEHARNRLRPYQ
jgi:hypothetical protein